MTSTPVPIPTICTHCDGEGAVNVGPEEDLETAECDVCMGSGSVAISTNREPWSAGRLNQHIVNIIRERADIAWVMEDDGEGGQVPALRNGAPITIWLLIQEGIEQAGWRLTRG